MKIKNILLLIIVQALTLTAIAQQEAPQSTDSSFDSASSSMQSRLTEALAELSALREKISAEEIPLSRKLNKLESELIDVRLEYKQARSLLDNRLLGMTNLRAELKTRQEESTYLLNLLGEYIRNFESRLHIAEIHRYQDVLERARLAPENSNLSQQQVYQCQAAMLTESLRRLENALGGDSFEGTAVNDSGLVKSGTFVMVGPSAIFLSDDGQETGAAEQRLGSLEPAIISFGNPLDADAARGLISNSSGFFPLDPTMGNAHKIEATEQTLEEHMRKGGPVMIPILAMAAITLLVALYKWLALSILRKPSPKRINALLDAVAKRDAAQAKLKVAAIGGPVGKMLAAGVEHLSEPRDLIEEVMYETVLATRLKLQRMLPFIAISAASAPLLGLLGTVTGIINTFKLITVFGSGDVKTLSGGISEALITTEFGLIVAIPSLLLHAFLSRKARSVVDQMEKAAVAFVNQVSKTPVETEKPAKSDPED